MDDFQEQGESVVLLCHILGISRASYYKNRHRLATPREKQNKRICAWIRYLHRKHKQKLGYRRMAMYINRHLGAHYSRGYIRRLMGYLGLQSRIRRRRKNYRKVKPDVIAENILSRDFRATKPNEKWLTDVTEFSIPGDSRKLYLSPILDLYDNSIPAYSLSFRNNNQLVFEMFRMARKKYPDATPLFHDDRGFQYTSRAFKKLLDEAGMVHSMSRPGRCIDNGPMEGFFGTLKTEMFYGMRFDHMDQLIEEIHNYIYYYQHERWQEKLGCMAPEEFRRHTAQ